MFMILWLFAANPGGYLVYMQKYGEFFYFVI